MKLIEGSSAVRAAVFVALWLNIIFLCVNGVFMIVAPLTWYNAVPGVTQTGFFNQHFIRDIGMIQFFLGAAFAVGLFRPKYRVGLWAAATLWLIAHALFHVWEVLVGICASSTLVRDFPAVSLPAILGILLSLWAIKQRRTRI